MVDAGKGRGRKTDKKGREGPEKKEGNRQTAKEVMLKGTHCWCYL